MSTAAAVCAALYERERSGRGQLVSTSLLRQGIYTLAFDVAVVCRLGTPVAPAQRSTMYSPTVTNYATRDGRRFWVVGLDAERHWPPLARAVGRPEWLSDARFADASARARNAGELIALLDEIFATRTLAEWAAVFDATEDFFWAPVQSIDEVVNDPQVHAAGGLVEVPDGEGTALLPAAPVDFERTPGLPRGMAPALGQHSDEVLRELGRSASQIETLRRSGVVA
jgi:crotonobetainyl-CoA:carnitine CoA-transferase CaiB-like acyl-CoA transferase